MKNEILSSTSSQSRMEKWSFLPKVNLKKIYKNPVVYPKKENVFRVFEICPPEKIRVLILGLDPYTDKCAHGIAFSSCTEKKPPSLQNIFKELEDDLGIKRQNFNLTDWVEQGIFLLNVALTVAEKPESHLKLWADFTEKLLKYLNTLENLKLVILLGNRAQKYEKYFTKKVLKFVHPSPLSARRGFFGCKMFSKILQEDCFDFG